MDQIQFAKLGHLWPWCPSVFIPPEWVSCWWSLRQVERVRFDPVICQRSVLEDIVMRFHEIRNLDIFFLYIIPKILQAAYVLDLPIQTANKRENNIRTNQKTTKPYMLCFLIGLRNLIIQHGERRKNWKSPFVITWSKNLRIMLFETIGAFKHNRVLNQKNYSIK